MTAEGLAEIKKRVLSLPLLPGVYLMLDERGEVIYIGKAKRLKNRVSSYFQDSQNHNDKTKKLVSHIANFDYIVASSEFEALMLECSLIKRHQPQYNILLKDDRGFHYIRVDMREEYPRLELSPVPRDDGALWFGPYYGYFAAKAVQSALNETLKLPDCSRVFPRDIGKERPCLIYHMKRCVGICLAEVSKDEYRALISSAIEILEGKYEKIAAEVQADMETAAEELMFERAAALRDRYNGIMKLGARQNVIAGKLADTDVVGFYGGARAAIAVLRYLDGALMDKQVEVLEPSVEGTNEEILDAFLTQFYANTTRALPRQILLPFDIENRENIAKMLSENAERKVEILVPQRGDKLFNIRLAEKNAREEAERLTTRRDRGERTLKLLREALALENPPRRIEAFDISNLAGTDVVASMTVYKDGAPQKSEYRRFKIKTVEGQDDYGSMREAVTRRLERLNSGDPRFSNPPDLFLIDGGAEHARVVEDVQKNFGTEIPTYGMVKDTRHRTRALITSDGREVAIAQNATLFGFVGRIQEETHRFAIEYNRSLRRKRIYGSELDKIEGVGKTRRAALLREFKSMKRIREATVEELAKILPQTVAESAYEYFRSGESSGEEPGEGTTE